MHDVKNDPDELISLADNAGHKVLIEEMTTELEDWKQLVGDPLDNDDVENSFKAMGGVKDLDHRARDWKGIIT